MPADEFGLLKNVFGIDDQATPTAIEAATEGNAADFHKRPAISDEQRSAMRQAQDRDHAAHIRGDHQHQLNARG